jgi:hypothetical protein
VTDTAEEWDWDDPQPVEVAGDEPEGEPDIRTQVDADPLAGMDIRELRERAKRHDEAQATIAALNRENEWLRSGLDLNSPVGQLFVKAVEKGGWHGEFTAANLRAEAEKYAVPLKQYGVQESVVVDDFAPSERRLFG